MRLRITEAVRRAEIPRASFTAIDALLAETNARLKRLTEAEARRLFPVVEDALRGITERIASGRGEFTAWDMRGIRAQLLKAKAVLSERMGDQLARSDTKAQFAAIADMRHEVAVLSRHFGKPRALDIDTILTVTDTSHLLVTRIAKAAAKRSRETVNGIASALGSGAAQGMSWRDAAKLMQQRMGAEESNCERLARTEFVHAHNLQRAEVAKAEGYQLMWNAATYRTCDKCRALDGEKRADGVMFVIDESGRPVMFAPRHPQCRCSCVLWRPEWKD